MGWHVAVASGGPYANHLHVSPERTMPATHQSIVYRRDALPYTQPTIKALKAHGRATI